MRYPASAVPNAIRMCSNCLSCAKNKISASSRSHSSNRTTEAVGLCAIFGKSAAITWAILGYPPVVCASASRISGCPSGGTCTAPTVTPVDSIVETRIFEYHGERRGDLVYTKEMLLAIGDRYEEQIAQDRVADAAYR